MLEVVDRVHLHLVLLENEARVGVGGVEHVEHVFQGEELGDDFFADAKRIDEVKLTAVVDLNKTELLPVYVKVELSLEIHGHDVHVAVREALAEVEEFVIVRDLDVASGHG